nr:hypothetical protein BaRGS_026900 [Batillaria attramentaria]
MVSDHITTPPSSTATENFFRTKASVPWSTEETPSISSGSILEDFNLTSVTTNAVNVIHSQHFNLTNFSDTGVSDAHDVNFTVFNNTSVSDVRDFNLTSFNTIDFNHSLEFNLTPSLANYTRFFPLVKQPAFMVAILVIAYGAVFVLALMGNLSVIGVVIRDRRFHSPTWFFIVNLAVADVLVAIFCVPVTLAMNIYSALTLKMSSVCVVC